MLVCLRHAGSAIWITLLRVQFGWLLWLAGVCLCWLAAGAIWIDKRSVIRVGSADSNRIGLAALIELVG